MSNTEAKHINENSVETSKDLYKAWYQKTAQYNLALSYENGKGTEKNLDKAFYWHQKAAENGYIQAQYNLAILYYKVKKQKRI